MESSFYRSQSNKERNSSDYRKRIYSEYGSLFQDADTVFDKNASCRWGKAYNYYLRGWLPHNKNAAIVDLACGGGKILHFLKDRGYQHIQGVDISPEQIRLALQVLPDVAESDVLYFLENRSSCFDLILGLDIIEHFHKEEALRFLDGCLMALKPGGRLILQTPNADSPWGNVIRYSDFSHEICFNPNSITRIMHLCGFCDIETREQGPVPWGYSAISTVRFVAWQTMRLGLKLWNIVETGNAGSGVLSRVFLVSGCK